MHNNYKFDVILRTDLLLGCKAVYFSLRLEEKLGKNLSLCDLNLFLNTTYKYIM
jgi:hypothetical protein